MIVLSALVERLQYWFAEEGICSQLITEDVKSLDILRQLSLWINDEEARYQLMQHENSWTQAHVRQFEKILYRIEDLVESHLVEVASRNKVCMMRSIFQRMCGWMADHNLRAKLNSLIHQINDILVDFQNDNLVPVRPPEPSQGCSSRRDNVGGPGLQRTSTMVGEYSDGGQIIGMEDDEEKLVSALTEGSRSVEIVSICGMGGIGKTTLARTLYSKPEVRQHFNVRAWLVISPNFKIRDIFRSILSQVTHLDSELLVRLQEMDLADNVYKYLKGRRWLVVLDDVWDANVWKSINLAFPDDNNGSRILVTTRNRDAALSMSKEEHIHHMCFLDEVQSWELFKRTAELTDSELDSEKEQIAKEIVKQSGGLPLAIIVLAGFLKTKSLDEWKSVLEAIAVKISVPDTASRTLDLSYNSLPSVLKPCLLYMGIFPEDSKIEADTICQLWITEGLVSEEHCRINGVTMMKLAGDYLNELVSRSLVQVSEEGMSTHQSFSHVRLHDLIRGICILKAKEEEFFEIVELGQANQPEASGFRCALYLDKHKKMEIHPYLTFDLRSLLFFNSYQQSGEDSISQWTIPNLSNLKWLRILHFDGVDFRGGTLPAGVENLVLLRHLSLRNCYLEKLPPYVSDFLFLITLDLRVKKGSEVIIPNVLCKLQKLRHLYLPLKFKTPNHDKLQLDGLKDLEILENFDTSKCNAREIFMLTRWRHLALSSEGNLQDLEEIFTCIESNANHLRKTSLDIRNFDSYSEERLSFIEKLFSCRVLHILRLEGRIAKMPELDATYTSFTEIHLNGSQLEDDPMQTLQKLPHLRILVLECEAYIGKEMYCSGFPELGSLKLSKLYNLESWKVEEYAMPCLSTLIIENCRRMKKLPEDLGHINALRKLKINMMSKEFVGRLRKVDGKGGEDLDKINAYCTIEFGSDNIWPESTDSVMEQNNSFEDKFAEFQISSSSGTRDFASSSACPPPNEWERDVYLQ